MVKQLLTFPVVGVFVAAGLMFSKAFLAFSHSGFSPCIPTSDIPVLTL